MDYEKSEKILDFVFFENCKAYICESGTSLPSNFQVMWGVGVPDAIHFSETSGPGFNKWPMNLYFNVGLDAVNKKKN